MHRSQLRYHYYHTSNFRVLMAGHIDALSCDSRIMACRPQNELREKSKKHRLPLDLFPSDFLEEPDLSVFAIEPGCNIYLTGTHLRDAFPQKW